MLIDSYHAVIEAQPGLALLCIEASVVPRPARTAADGERVASLRAVLLDWIESLGDEARPDVDREGLLLVALSVLNFYLLPTPFGSALGGGPVAGPNAIERHMAAALDILLHGLVALDPAFPARDATNS